MSKIHFICNVRRDIVAVYILRKVQYFLISVCSYQKSIQIRLHCFCNPVVYITYYKNCHVICKQ